ncbi:hypothetical protein [Kocuria sp. U4B]
MSQFTTAPADTSARRQLSLVPSALEVSSTYLTPADPFPAALAELALVELLVLHSRITRQLEYEYIDAAGPHPVTLDRAQELADELDTRQDFLTSTSPVPPEAPQTEVPRAARRQPPGPRRRPAAGHHPAAPSQPAPALPGQDQHHPAALTPVTVGEEDRREKGLRIYDLARLRPGDRIQVWHRGQLQDVGTVEEAAPSLGVVWIREGLDGYRRMIHAHDDTELRSSEPSPDE